MGCLQRAPPSRRYAPQGEDALVYHFVTPDIDPDTGAIKGYHSCRRKAPPQAVAQITELYQVLLAEERRHPSKSSAIEASTALLLSILEERGQTYEEFVFDLFASATSFAGGRSRFAA